MASWTLWQPLVPRYQLTAKEVTTEDVNTQRPRSTPASPRVRDSNSIPQSPRTKNHQSGSSHRKTKKKMKDNNIETDDSGASLQIGEGHNVRQGMATMYFTTGARSDPRHQDKGVVIKPAFPRRPSPYVDNFKQQQRINSARQSFQDPSTTSPRPRTTPTSPRHRIQRTVSQFPVTNIENQQELMSQYYRPLDVKIQDKPRAKTAMPRTKPRFETSIALPQRRVSCKSAGPAREITNNVSSLSVNTMYPSDKNSKPFLKNPLYKDQYSPRRYAVRKFDDATMFIDDDKIIFIKKKTTKNDILISQNNTDDANYIKQLRKLYLREPKDIAKFAKEPVVKKKNVIRERLEYDMKTDHILNYYSRVDDKHDATLWAMAVDESRKNRTPCTTPRSASGPRRAESGLRRQSINASPPRSARGRDRDRDRDRERDRDRGKERPVSARSLTYSNTPDGAQMNHDTLSDWNVFLKFNSKSVLHERQFYLQTPGTGITNMDRGEMVKEAEASCDNHGCRLCRLEKEMGMQPIGNANPVVEEGQGQDKEMNALSNARSTSPIQKVSESNHEELLEPKCEHEETNNNHIGIGNGHIDMNNGLVDTSNGHIDMNTTETETSDPGKGNLRQVRTVSTSTTNLKDACNDLKPLEENKSVGNCTVFKTINVNIDMSLNSKLENTEDNMNNTMNSCPPPEVTNKDTIYDNQSIENGVRGRDVDFGDERGSLNH